MQIIPLQTLPNQSFNIVLDNNSWGFALKTCNGETAASITLNNNIVIENTRAIANGLIIPSIYEEADSGNFMFLTQNFQLPDYTQFGVTQVLVYLTASELTTIREPLGYPITANDFNSIAALPLRFAPQGY